MAQIAKRPVEASKGPDEKAEARGKVSINAESQESREVSIDPKPGNNSRSRVSCHCFKLKDYGLDRRSSHSHKTTQNDPIRYSSLES